MFGKNLKPEVFVSGGVKNWRKALGLFQKHETAQSHKDSVVCWQSYKACLSKGNVVEQIENASSSDISERREYLKRVVAVICMLGKQSVPFRGHNELLESNNKGNLKRKSLNLSCKHIPLQQTAPTSHLQVRMK